MNKERLPTSSHAELDFSGHKPTTGIVRQIKEKLALKRIEIIRDVTIDAETARDLLSMNKGNRVATLLNCQRYADDMLNGKWKDHVDPFVITTEGWLRNGQKRCFAVHAIDLKNPELKLSFVADIMVGLPPDVGPVLDTGKMRSLADALKDKGLKNVHALAAAIRTIYYLENFQRLGGGINKADVMRNDQIDQWTENKKSTALVEKLVSYSEEFRAEKTLLFFAPSGYAAIWYWLHKRNAEEAKSFMTKLATGADLNSRYITDNNITHLRNLLLELYVNADKRFSSGRQDERYRYVIYAWNASRNGIRIESVKKMKPDFENPDIEKPI